MFFIKIEVFEVFKQAKRIFSLYKGATNFKIRVT